MITRVRGTQDFLDMSLFNFVIEEAKKHVINYNFREIATPIVEHIDLFKRSLGTYTDVVSKEMFVIEGRDGDEQLCLRPEATASTVRAFIDGRVQHVPWKVFSWGPMFRYERPQKGRYRQFHQFNIEVIGSSAIAQDVQLIIMLDRFFHEKLRINSAALTINFLGCLEDRTVFKIILKKFLDKQLPDALCSTCLERKERNIMRIFDCKNPACQAIYVNAPLLIDHLCEPCGREWQQLQNQLLMLSVSFSIKPSLVRGLDYYNKTVFEFVSNTLGAQNAFCGGGRYDSLVTQLGGKHDQPSIGASIGIERLLLIIESSNNLTVPHPRALHAVLPMTPELHSLGLLVADTLHAAGLCTDLIVDGSSFKSMMSKANRMNALYAIIIGQEECETRTVTVKHMVTGLEQRIAQIDLVNYLTR